MPPKNTKAAAPRKDKEQQKEKEVEVVAAAPSATIMGPIAAKATTGFSYKAMLTKNPPAALNQEAVAAPAAAAAAAPAAKPAAPPQLVDLPGAEKKNSAAEEPKKATKKGGKAKKEATVAAAEPAAEAAPVETAAVEPTVEESEPPQVVIEVATPVVQPPASPEKIVADDEVAIPRAEAPQVSHEEKEQESKHFSWAEAEPGYSAFSNNHFFTEAPAAAAQLPSVVEALTAPASLVTFRNGSASRRYHFVAPTNDKVVTSLMAILQTREDQATLREETIKKREEELHKRELGLEASLRKYNEDHARLISERSALATERELVKQQQQQQIIAQQQQHQQQQHQPQPAIPQVSQGHHSAHHPQMSSMPPREQGVHPASYGRPHHMGGQHQQPMGEMNWAAEDEMYMQGGYEYAHQPMYQQAPRGYGRPGGVSHQHAPRANYNNRMNMPGQMGGYPQQQGYTQPRMPRAAPMVNYDQYPPQQQPWRDNGY